MNEAAFLINIKNCKRILEAREVLKKTNLKNVQICTYKKYSEIFRSTAQKGDYVKTFIKGLEMDDYDFLLKDGSFFQFSFDKDEDDYILRLAFYPSINVISYADFLHEILEMDIEECGSYFIDDYQQYLMEQETNYVTPVRYDYNSKIYRPLVHSSSHVHFGYEENLRVPVDKKLFPSAFVKFILQHFYYNKWKENILQGELKDFVVGNAEKEVIDKKYWGNDEMKIPFISFT